MLKGLGVWMEWVVLTSSCGSGSFLDDGSSYPQPYTLHPTPHTLQPAPNNLHPTPYNLNPTRHPTPEDSESKAMKSIGCRAVYMVLMGVDSET